MGQLRGGLYICIILVCIYVVIQNGFINRTLLHRHRVFSDTLTNASKIHFPCQRKFWNTLYMYMVSRLGQTDNKTDLLASQINIKKYLDSMRSDRETGTNSKSFKSPAVKNASTHVTSDVNLSNKTKQNIHWLEFSKAQSTVLIGSYVQSNVKYSLPQGITKENFKLRKAMPLPQVPQDFDEAIRTHSKSETKEVIMSIVDQTYVEFGINFFETSIKKFGFQRIFLMVCTDLQSKRILSQYGIDCYYYVASVMQRATGTRGDFGTKGYFHKTNLKTLIVLQALRLGYTVLIVDLDIVFLKNPFKYFTCTSCDIHIQTDRVHLNSGFVRIRPTQASIQLYSIAWQEYLHYQKSHDQAYLNMAVTIMQNQNESIQIQTLPPREFPCGAYYFMTPTFRRVFGEPGCRECVIVHNNYIGSIAAKEYRFKENQLWLADHSGYYSNPATKYLVYDNPDFFRDGTLEIEKRALQSALAIGNITDRVVILPKFHCCDCRSHQCSPELHKCSLLSVLKLRTFDLIFKGKYREHTFLKHSKIPPHVKKYMQNLPSQKIFSIRTDLHKRSLLNKTANLQEFQPAIGSLGATSNEITKWFTPYSKEPVLVFLSLYNAFSKFTDENVQQQFTHKLKAAFECSSYEQWEVKERL